MRHNSVALFLKLWNKYEGKVGISVHEIEYCHEITWIVDAWNACRKSKSINGSPVEWDESGSPVSLVVVGLLDVAGFFL